MKHGVKGGKDEATCRAVADSQLCIAPCHDITRVHQMFTCYGNINCIAERRHSTNLDSAKQVFFKHHQHHHTTSAHGTEQKTIVRTDTETA